MARWFTMPLIVALVFSILGVTPASAESRPAYAPSELLVKFKPGTMASDVADAHRRTSGQLKEVISGIDVQLIAVPAGQEMHAVDAYSRSPHVLFAELNQLYHGAATWTPNDPRVKDQWHLNNTGQTGGTPDADTDAFEAWAVEKGSNTIKIAILDSGIDQTHEDLKSKIDAAKNFTNSPTSDDRHGHGTHVAGIAAAATNNQVGVAGVCPNCRLLNAKVLNDTLDSSYAWVANGITWATNNGAKVITMSFGSRGSYSKTVEDAVNYAWGKGVILTAAAHNSNEAALWYPAAYDNVIAVGATDSTGKKADFSNYGPWVDVAAPGKDIYSTLPDHRNQYQMTKYGITSGTSMAAPQVAGLAGLLWAKGMCVDGDAITNDAVCVRSRIEMNTDTYGTGIWWAHGRVNLFNSLTLGAVPTGPTADIDNEPDLSKWERYAEPPGSTSNDVVERLTDMSGPTGDNTVFHTTITSSSPYANVYWFQRKPFISDRTFTYQVWFKWSAGSRTAPEALEFPFSVYTGARRLEAAVQWVTGHDGQGARWRVWGVTSAGRDWTETNASGQPWNFAQAVAPDVWHTLSLTASIQNDQVYYHSFTVDGQTFAIDSAYQGVDDSTPAQTVMAFQLDNNYFGNHQEVWLDGFTLAWTP